MKPLIFDTSGVNALAKNSEASALVAGLCVAYYVVEVAADSDEDKRKMRVGSTPRAFCRAANCIDPLDYRSARPAFFVVGIGMPSTHLRLRTLGCQIVRGTINLSRNNIHSLFHRFIPDTIKCAPVIRSASITVLAPISWFGSAMAGAYKILEIELPRRMMPIRILTPAPLRSGCLDTFCIFISFSSTSQPTLASRQREILFSSREAVIMTTRVRKCLPRAFAYGWRPTLHHSRL